jgi:transposase InsO family protein
MLDLIFMLVNSLLIGLRSRGAMQAEIIALRHQLIVLQRTQNPKRLVLHRGDRCFWVWLSRVWSRWRSSLVIVKPETVIGWHRQGFRWYWTWKIRHGRRGRPRVPKDTRDLIRTMSRANPIWGAPRIHGELMKLGIKISEASVAKYMVRQPKPPSQTWRTFLNNHVPQLASVDFFTVYTVWFEILFVFIVLAHDRRRVVHFNVTAHPTAEWTAQQMLEAFPFDTAPKYFLRDRDRIYGQEFREQVEVMNINEVLSAPRSPWQRAYVERVIGSIRRECLDHVLVFDEDSLRRTLRCYFSYYHRWRLHLSLGKDSPDSRPVQWCSRLAESLHSVRSADCIMDTSASLDHLLIAESLNAFAHSRLSHPRRQDATKRATNCDGSVGHAPGAPAGSLIRFMMPQKRVGRDFH